MNEKIDWPSMIGRRVSGVSRGTGTTVLGTLEAFGYDRSGQYWVIRQGQEDGCRDWWCIKPILLPEKPEWKPKVGEWVWHGGNGDSFEEGWIATFDADVAKDWEVVRPLTDDELIDVCGGIESMRRIVEERG